MKNKNTRRGFTLIELLVVVLIIGVLAAIALPQYQVAVMKVRYQQAVMLGDAWVKAQQFHYLSTGKYTVHFNELDIDFPTPLRSDAGPTSEAYYYSWGNCTVWGDVLATVYLQCRATNGPVHQRAVLPKGEISRRKMCSAQAISVLQQRVCSLVSGLPEPQSKPGSWDYYY